MQQQLAANRVSLNRVVAPKPCSARRLGVCRASQKGKTDTRTTDKILPSNVGFKWDGSNLRWVRDDRYAGQTSNIYIQPKSGSAYVIWPVVHTLLTEKGLRSVKPAEALKMQKQGWTIVDVRIEGDFEGQHCEGAVNVPLYRFVQGTALWDNIKKIAMAGFAMKATERDPDYVATILSRLKKNQKVILCCAIGGTLDTKVRTRPDKYKEGINDPDRSFGRESRSLKAAYEFFQAGWSSSNLVFIEGGYQQWKYDGLPIATSDE
eukprot:CAMPEP_0202865800 /NCGR_PEP_ID=MMETSP1391-20130828/6358_1 /ASSEMBLY_ACC=CAM_ASM_000867 /TAXON_ID=1034604 /ORGANISM="Chlamydomonas leiostraca, Strain SAG 11-49" /LENGTH=262 /DNA_ID=CAMNT_0049545677 /DNA_START=1 /DNA_END=789 /DNA_ORIENTATION=-